ncbi:MAG: hypothetical protein AAGJ83_16465 [Planctomycetota bacterium]
MPNRDEPLAESLDAHLDVEQSVVDAVCKINQAMADVLNRTGIKGPSEEELRALEPHLIVLRERSERSRQSRLRLSRRFPDLHIPTESHEQEEGSSSDAVRAKESQDGEIFSALSRQLPEQQRSRLDDRRKSLSEDLATAQATLASNQVLVYYSMDFHRRYLMGVLRNADQAELSSYSADGQSFAPQPETLFGRNC